MAENFKSRKETQKMPTILIKPLIYAFGAKTRHKEAVMCVIGIWYKRCLESQSECLNTRLEANKWYFIAFWLQFDYPFVCRAIVEHKRSQTTAQPRNNSSSAQEFPDLRRIDYLYMRSVFLIVECSRSAVQVFSHHLRGAWVRPLFQAVCGGLRPFQTLCASLLFFEACDRPETKT